MTITLDELTALLGREENERLEFKTATNGYEFDNLLKYCVALANEGGGHLVLGVTNSFPREVVGTKAFQSLERTKTGLLERLHLRVNVNELLHPNGRVLVFDIPSRPIGMPIQNSGSYLMRSGESLVAMTPDQLQKIFAEAGPDFSGEICEGASLADLDTDAITRFREMWIRKSANQTLWHLSDLQLLCDADLIQDGQILYAALILLGTRQALGKFLAQAEVIFEYRSTEDSVQFQQRKEFRHGFLLFLDDLWSMINLRNDVQHYQEGLFVWDISTFNEAVIREALLNALCHRDYRLGGSVFVRQFPRKIEIESPGGFPPGINPENILWRQLPRNRRIAEALAKCGLVERSGQGANRMYEECIRESKPEPDFVGSDDFQVCLTLRGEVQDPLFLKFFQEVNRTTQVSFGMRDLLVLDKIRRDEKLPEALKDRLVFLKDHGIIESVGRGRGVRHILSRRYHKFVGEKGAYTRRRGLDREANKALVLKHLDHFDQAKIKDFEEALPGLSRGKIHTLLRTLRAEGKIRRIGSKKGSFWKKV